MASPYYEIGQFSTIFYFLFFIFFIIILNFIEFFQSFVFSMRKSFYIMNIFENFELRKDVEIKNVQEMLETSIYPFDETI